MFGFPRQHTKDSRDVEQLIFDVAEHQRDADLLLLFNRLVGLEVYVPILMSSLPATLEPAVPYTTQTSDRLQVRTVAIQNYGACTFAATLSSHSTLENSYVGMQWVEFLRMTHRIAAARGAVLQGRTSWIALDQQRVAYVLEQSTPSA